MSPDNGEAGALDQTPTQLSVLLVEDNPGDARLVEELLNEGMRGKFSLVHSQRLSAAIEHVSSSDVDVILLDLSLPDSSGLKTFARCRESAPNVATVVLTGTQDEHLAAQALREGAQDYLIKGDIDSATLSRSMRYAVERKRVEDQIRRMAAERETLAEIGKIVSSSSKISDVYEMFAEQVRKLVSWDRIVIAVIDRETQTVASNYVTGLTVPDWDLGHVHTLKGTLAQLTSNTRSGVIVNLDEQGVSLVQHASSEACVAAGLLSTMAAPLLAGDTTIGVLTLHSKDIDAYGEADLRLVEQVAAQIAGSIAQNQLLEELQHAMSKIKTLSGLIPICASCKRIRDDSGYWSQIETYIRDHSDAVFSHGICPTCVKTMYPDLQAGGDDVNDSKWH